MKDIEKIILDRKEEFNKQEPGSGHFERFSQNLSTGKRSSFLLFKVAATIIIAIFISLATYIYLGLSQAEQRVTDFSPEIQETIYYYNTLNREMESKIMKSPLKNKKEKKMIQNDLEQYEKYYEQLINDLNKFPNDQRVINAVIEYHRSRTQLLEHILEQLQRGERI